MELRVISWNLFHGRDHTPNPSLHTWRSRLLRITERDDRHAQVNRDLYAEFAELLGEAEWDVALLQECPPRWAEALARRCRAEPHLTLTSRNLPPPLNRAQALAATFSPDLVASWEGGSNLTLVRGRVNDLVIGERCERALTRRPERRRMALTRLTTGPCLANLHASTDRRSAAAETAWAASVAGDFAGDAPLIFGGDLNLRPDTDPALFSALEHAHGLRGPTSAGAIDHLLHRGLAALEAPTAWASERREAQDPTAGEKDAALAIRLSDHAPVEALFEF